MIWWLVLTGPFVLLASLFIAVLRRESGKPQVVCLMYHRLATAEVFDALSGTERVYTLPVEQFESQLQYLSDNGFRFLAPDELVAYVRGELVLTGPAVLLTFDDGCVSVYEKGVPLLEKFDATALMFVTIDPTSYVFGEGQRADRRMTDDEIRDAQSRGLLIGSHSMTHRPLRSLEDSELRHELVESKRVLENILGSPVNDLALPGNWGDARVMNTAASAGYRAVWRSTAGRTRVGDSLFGLPRVNIDGEMTLQQFAATLTPLGLAQRRFVFQLKSLPARLLGPAVWGPIRATILKLTPGGYISFARWRKVFIGIVCVAAVVIVLLAIGYLRS